MFEHGALVEIRSRYDGAWVGGFEVAEASAAGYRLRRLSDGRVLPGAAFPPGDVQRADGHRARRPAGFGWAN